MKKMKKYVIGFVAAMVLSTGLVTAAFASGAIVWGGEGDIAIIRNTLIFLDDKLGTTLSENETLASDKERLEEELEKYEEENTSPSGLAKQNKELREKVKTLESLIETLKVEAEVDKTTISELTTEKELLDSRVSELEALEGELRAEITLSNELTQAKQDQLSQALIDVKLLSTEAQEIRNSYGE